jgi:hypothetical protein
MKGLSGGEMAGHVHLYQRPGGAPQPAYLDWEDSMRPGLALKVSYFCVVLAALAVFLPSGQAQTIDVSGRYECSLAKVAGKVVPCAAALLTLKNDGKFELRGWEGSYLVDGQWVELSDSVVKSRAKIEPGHKIVFRYHGKHGWCEMTYERRVAELGKMSLS